ncbi:MAG: DUF4280 domain-containing protein [Hungatella sp.]|jgi:hypothetical protein|nr:DUF4280 domain-containing protein [Hungatella sp.]
MAELKDTFVVHGACATCSMGMRPSQIVLQKTHGVFLKEQAQMTVEDCKANDHVICFGGCYSMENPKTQEAAEKVRKDVEEACPNTFLDKVMGFFTGGKKKKEEAAPAEEGVPQVLGECMLRIIASEWDYGKDGVETDEKHPLMGGAKLHCIYGGEIEIVDPGQPEAGSGTSTMPQNNPAMGNADFMQGQFGFNEKASKTMKEVYDKIQEKYKELSQMERNWLFARAISQLGDYNNKTVNVLFLKIETHAWRKGAGWAYKYDKEEKFFIESLGIKKEDYQYLRQMVRLQHFMSSDPLKYSYDALKQKHKKKTDDFNTWKSNMENATGKTFSDQEYLDYYKELYQSFGGKGDYSHMMYTIAANLNDNRHKVDNKWNNIGAKSLSWKNAEERKDVTGWLGDAVYTGDNNKISFGMDDYIADLDADNIAYRTADDTGLLDCMEQYYSDISSGNQDELRTKEFLENNSYEDIEKAVFDRIMSEDKNHDGKKNVEDLKDNETYKGTYDFLIKLKNLRKK